MGESCLATGDPQISLPYIMVHLQPCMQADRPGQKARLAKLVTGAHSAASRGSQKSRHGMTTFPDRQPEEQTRHDHIPRPTTRYRTGKTA